MLDTLMQSSPSPASWRYDPMTTSEIDAHPDADRIWATVAAIQGEAQAAREEGYEEGAGDIEKAEEIAAKEEFDRCESELDRWTDKFLEAAEDMTAQEIRDALIATDWREVLE